MTCFLNIAIQVCVHVVLKSVLSKAIARYRAKVMLQDREAINVGVRRLENFQLM